MTNTNNIGTTGVKKLSRGNTTKVLRILVGMIGGMSAARGVWGARAAVERGFDDLTQLLTNEGWLYNYADTCEGNLRELAKFIEERADPHLREEWAGALDSVAVGVKLLDDAETTNVGITDLSYQLTDYQVETTLSRAGRFIDDSRGLTDLKARAVNAARCVGEAARSVGCADWVAIADERLDLEKLCEGGLEDFCLRIAKATETFSVFAYACSTGSGAQKISRLVADIGDELMFIAPSCFK